MVAFFFNGFIGFAADMLHEHLRDQRFSRQQLKQTMNEQREEVLVDVNKN